MFIEHSNVFNLLGDETTKVCGISDIDCYTDAYLTFWEKELTDESMRDSTQESCQCLPSCTSIE